MPGAIIGATLVRDLQTEVWASWRESPAGDGFVTRKVEITSQNHSFAVANPHKGEVQKVTMATWR